MAVEGLLQVTVDALRADHCGFLGYDGATTPFLDSLAAESLVFESAFAVGPGTPSPFASLFSSRYPLEFGGYEGFSATRPSLPEHLERRGVTTAGIHSNPYLSRHYGYDRGFDHFEDSFEDVDEPGLLDRVKTETGRCSHVTRPSTALAGGSSSPPSTASSLTQRLTASRRSRRRTAETLQKFRIDTPGCTAIYLLERLKDRYDDDEAICSPTYGKSKRTIDQPLEVISGAVHSRSVR